MIDGPTLVVFLFSCLMLSALPGPALLLVLGTAALRGARAGMLVAFGTTLGLAVHIVGVAIGLSAIIMKSTMLFQIVKWVGVAYLCYLGLKLVLTRQQAIEGHAANQRSTAKTLREGFLTNATNPKAAIFFLSLFPQFVPSDAAHPILAIFLLGGIVMIVDMGFYSLVALGAGRLARILSSRPRIAEIQQRVCGSLLLFFAGALTATQRKTA